MLIIFFALYLFTILWFTILKRSTGYHVAQFELFWSYKKWFAGDVDLGNEIMANIAMFIPFGFMLSAVLPTTPSFKDGTKAAVVIAAAIAFSLLIETLQLFMMRGLFEWDDIINNGIGAVIGVAVYTVLEKLLKGKRFNTVIFSIGAVFTATCIGVFIHGGGTIGVEADTTSRAYCFQVDRVEMNAGEVEIEGFTFRYDHPGGEPVLTLRAEDGEVKLSMEYGLQRPDVNEFFLCENDYTDCGFRAKGQVEDREYEIYIRWPWSPEISTGVFIGPDGIRYSSDDTFTAPDVSDAPDLREIIEEGTLRVYRPDYHCWVYQKDWDLYWIVDRDFNFEDDGSTYIQYQMWTTQTENLPEKRLAHGNLWDNISGHFEKYEIEGDFGDYRVMKREIPTAYSVTSIVTGYYKSGEWIWKSYFRPVYEFAGGEQ